MKVVKLILVVVASSILLMASGFVLGRASVEKKEPIVVKSRLSDWEIFELAVMKTESGFDSLAVGKTKDIGLFQITPIYVKELNRLKGDTTYIHTQAFSPMIAIEMFNTMQEFKNPTYDIDKAIHMHNPNGDSIGYAKKVKENIAFIKRYETIRETLQIWHEISEKKSLGRE